MNAVLLPNGKILAMGGSGVFNEASTAALNAEIFDPISETWAPAGTNAYARLYHSSALLLPDATVWVAGSNPRSDQWDAAHGDLQAAVPLHELRARPRRGRRSPRCRRWWATGRRSR